MRAWLWGRAPLVCRVGEELIELLHRGVEWLEHGYDRRGRR